MCGTLWSFSSGSTSSSSALLVLRTFMRSEGGEADRGFRWIRLYGPVDPRPRAFADIVPESKSFNAFFDLKVEMDSMTLRLRLVQYQSSQKRINHGFKYLPRRTSRRTQQARMQRRAQNDATCLFELFRTKSRSGACFGLPMKKIDVEDEPTTFSKTTADNDEVLVLA